MARTHDWKWQLLGVALGASLLTPTLTATAHASDRCYGEWMNAYQVTGDWASPDDGPSNPPAWSQVNGAFVECGGRVGYVGLSESRSEAGEVDAWVCDDHDQSHCGEVTNPTDDPDHYVACYAQIMTDNPACPGTKLDDNSGQVYFGYEMRDYTEGPDIRVLPMDEHGQRLICTPTQIRAVCITNPS